MAMKRYEGYGINWMHYMEGEFNDEDMTVSVTREYRIHKAEGPFPEVERGEYFTRTVDGRLVVQIATIENCVQTYTTYRVVKG